MKRVWVLLWLLGVGAFVRAEETAPVETSTAPHPSGFDRAHGFISRRFTRPLAWFDRFFLTEDQEIETNRSFLRVIPTYEWVNRDGFEYRTRVRAKVRLPALKERLSLVVEGEDDEFVDRQTTARTRTVANPVPVGLPRERPSTPNDEVALRYLVVDWIDSRIDVDTSLKSEMRAQVSLRFRQRIPLTHMTLGRLTINGFWLDRTGFGIRPRVDVERAINKMVGVRWNNQFNYIRGESGGTWESRLGMDAQIGTKEAMSFGFSFSGPTRPTTVVGIYRASVIYRRQMWREWFFVEFEPGLQWERSFTNSYPRTPTCGFRVEIRFQED